MPNRLANETSPYLLQHQNNPVDWFAWGDEAFEKALREDKPIFLSVGYSSCHWCHVMEHESFEDEDVAAVLNERFVSIKVDREERPDVDEAYMTAVQLGSGRGGWPMTVFMTPDRKPFFAGTYFPKEDRDRFPGFVTVLNQISQVWQSERPRLGEMADQFSRAMRDSLTHEAPETDAKLDDELLDNAVRALLADFDEERGGFGGAPKFPPHTSIEFLLNYALRESSPVELRQSAADMALLTLEKMALGGIHDHVGGGFHRYSTDERWLLPHFEKMLYDNALLLANYARAAAMCHGQAEELEASFSSIAEGIASWIAREMTSDQGLFYSALDADSEGEEGKYYVWTEEEIRAVLGDAAPPFLEAYQTRPEGNFHEEATGHLTGANILHLLEIVGDRFDNELATLLAHRETRIRPGLDDKVLVGWNGLMIGALAEAGEIVRAERAAEAILRYESEFGRLPRQIARKTPSGSAFLEDYAYLTDGLIALANSKALFEEVRPDERFGRTSDQWLEEAYRLTSAMIERFYDSEQGGFYFTSDDHEELFGRTKPAFDQPTPSANAVALKCLLTFGDMARARQTLHAFLGWMSRAPMATEALYLGAMAYLEDTETTSTPVAPVSAPQVRIDVPNRELVTSEGRGEGVVVIEIPTGFHINSHNPPARWLIPTAVSVQPLDGVVSYPAATLDRYEGKVEIPFTVTLPASASSAEFEVRVTYQACTETECLAPVERTFDVVIVRG